jgi:hypothetical protein
MNKFTCVSCADKQRICVFTPENITETQENDQEKPTI